MVNDGPMTWMTWGYLDFGKQPKNMKLRLQCGKSIIRTWNCPGFSVGFPHLCVNVPQGIHHSNDVLMYLIQPRSFNRDMRGISSFISGEINWMHM